MTGNTPARSHARWAPPALLLILPLLLIGLYTFPRFNGLYGQDPYAYFDYAVENFLPGFIVSFEPLPSFFWPPGYPILVSIAALLTGPEPLAGQIVSLGMGLLTPFATALLAYDLWPYRGERSWLMPLAAGILVAFTAQLWQSSVVVMADTTGLASATFGVWGIARYGRQVQAIQASSTDNRTAGGVQPGWLILGSVALAYAILTRWAYALVAIPVLLYCLFLVRFRPRRRAVTHLLIAGLAGGLVLSPLVVPVIETVLGMGSVGAPRFTGNLAVYSWNPVNAFRNTFFTTDGWLRYRLPNGLYYALIPAHVFYFTPLIAVFLIPGLIAIFRSRKVDQILLLAGWGGVVYLFHAGAPWQNFRFGLAYLPPAAIIASLGIAETAIYLRGRYRPFLIGAVVAGVVWMGIGGWLLTNRFIDRSQEDLESIPWLAERLPPDALLMALGLTQTIGHNSDIDTREFFNLDPGQIETLLAAGRPVFLFVQPDVIETQWRTLSPGLNFRWLEENHALEPIDNFRDYTLYEVVPKT
ncbi:MAG TPA: hypothetical protein VJ768_10545 [Anaerolineales bacterium]|nr:hypothetical protein [Anaerolineales bacterium]